MSVLLYGRARILSALGKGVYAVPSPIIRMVWCLVRSGLELECMVIMLLYGKMGKAADPI